MIVMTCLLAMRVPAKHHHQDMEEWAEQNHSKNKCLTGWDAEEEDGWEALDGHDDDHDAPALTYGHRS